MAQNWFATNAPTTAPAPSTDWFASNAPAADFKATNEPPSDSLWQKANTPLLPQIQHAAHAIADYLSQPRMADADLNKHVSGLGTLSASLRGGAAGMVEGAGDLLAGFSSPVGLALMLSGLEGGSAVAKAVPGLKVLLELPAVKGLQRAVQAGAGAGFAAHGAQQVVQAPTLAGKAQGAVEAATGALGMASALPRPRIPTNLNAEETAAVQFGRDRGVPIDAATATGNRAVAGVQQLADRSLGGSIVAGPAREAQTAALAKVGGELADQARGTSVAPEQAGQGIRDALASKHQAHTDLADAAYEKLRTLEAHPSNRMNIAKAPEAVDQLPRPIVAELRRVVHELDASGYTAGKLMQDDLDSSGTTYVNRTGGAAVYHDITAALGHEPTRADVQDELEAFLGGGKATAAVKAALGVAKARSQTRAGGRSTVSTPELPPSAMQTPTRLEAGRVTAEEIGLPVDTRAAKTALRPVYDQMMRQMPVAQQQMNPGLKALGNILDGPDFASLSQVDRDLSAIKAIARQHGGLAKLGAGTLDRAVQDAAHNAGPEVVSALHQGRQATIAKVQTEDLIGALPGGKLEEPLAVFKRATQPHDGGIEFLRAVKDHTPQALPQIARAKLEDLLAMGPDKQHAEWLKLGTETRKVLFPQTGQSQALDQFFLLSKRIAANPNPSGSGNQVSLGVQVGLLANPATFLIALKTQLGAAGLSALLHSNTGTQALTRALVVSRQPAASGAARAAALASLSSAVQKAGLPALTPAFGQADSRTETAARRK